MRANCSLTKLILASLKNKGECDRSIFAERLIQQEYVNTLDCEEKIDGICYNEPVCDNLKKFNCEMYFNNFKYAQTLNGLQVQVELEDIMFGVAPYTYEWSFDDSLFDLEIGYNTNNPILAIKWIVSPLATATISCKITDSKGCSFVLTKIITLCNDCIDINYDVSFKATDCWEKTNNKYRLPLSLDITCINGDIFTNQAYNLDLLSNDIDIIQDGGDWFLEIDDINLYKSKYCSSLVVPDIAISTVDFKVFKYDESTKNLSFLFTIPDPLPINLNHSRLILVQDIAYTSSKFFVLSYYYDYVSGNDVSIVIRYDIDWNTLTLTNPLYETLQSNLGFYLFSLSSIDDNRVLLGYSNVGCTPPSCYTDVIKEYDFSTNTTSSIINTMTMSPLLGISDTLFFNGKIYAVGLDISTSNEYLVRYDYITGGLDFTSSPIISHGNGTVGLALKNNIVYVFYDNGDVESYDLSFTYKGNVSILNNSVLGTGLVGGAGCSQQNELIDKIKYKLNYTYCSNDLSKEIEVIAPCGNDVCCEECTLSIDIVSVENCFSAYNLFGKNGYIAKINVIKTGCPNEELNLSYFLLINNVDSTKFTTITNIDGEYYIFSELDDWTDIFYYYTYTTCGVVKTFAGAISETITTLCCKSCIGKETFKVDMSIVKCVSYEEAKWIIKGDIIFSCPASVSIYNIDAREIYLNGVSIGVFFDNNGTIEFPNSIRYEDVCGVELEAKITIKVCGNYEYYTTKFTIPCGLTECTPCLPCGGSSSATVEMNLDELCFNEVESNTFQAKLFPYVNCGGNLSTNISSISIISNTTNCTFTIVKKFNQWYLQSSNCILSPISGTLTLNICWENC